MMHVRHVAEDDDERIASPRNVRRSTTAARSSVKQPLKKDPLRGSLHSETKQKRRNSLQSEKSHNSHASRNSQGSGGLHQQQHQQADDGFRFHGSQNIFNGSAQQFHGSHLFNGSTQQFSGSAIFSGSSVNSRQSHFSYADHDVTPATPVTGTSSITSRARRKVPGTPASQSSIGLKDSPKTSRGIRSNSSNPQTPSSGPATPTHGKKKIKKKPGTDAYGDTVRSTSTRTSYVTYNSSMDGSSERYQFSSDDEGVRTKGSPVKKRRPKVANPEPGSPSRRSATIVMAPHSPQVSSGLVQSGDTSPAPPSPSKGRRLVKKKKPRKPDDPDSPRRSVTARSMTRRTAAVGTDEEDNAAFYASGEELLTTDDEEYQVAPRQTPARPTRRPVKKKPLMRNADQQSFDKIPETPVGQRQLPSQIGRTPVRTASMISTSDEEFRIAPSRRSSFETIFTQTSAMTNNPTTTKLYEHARRCQWDEVMQEVRTNPRDAKTVGDKDGTTALHLAVMSRTNPMMRDGRVGEFKPAPLDLIEELVKACPEAASTRCARKRYTPLAYACLVADHGYDMDDSSEMVLILLRHAPGSVFVFTDDGFSAVDIHILSYSQIHKQKEEVYSGGRTSTVVLRTLLAEQPDLAESRVYKHKVRGPIELLYRCNTSEFQDAMIDDLTGDASDAKKKQLKSRFGSVASVLSDWWAWKWVLLLLKFSTIKDKKPGTIFSAVQAAARLVACPLPILALAINTFPHQVEERDPRGDIYNLPLHEVCSWRADEAILSGDPFVAGRKLKAIQLLLNEYPDAARMTNNMGETPLQLAVETCTPWHGGLELLVESCPKALKFPRKLRIGDQGLCLSVLNPSALDSVASYDSDEQDPMAAMEGMYPFALAAVLGGVAKNKKRIPLDFTDEQTEQHMQQLAQKDLQAVRSVFGLLRSRPDVLEKYRKDVTRDYLRMLKEQEDD